MAVTMNPNTAIITGDQLLSKPKTSEEYALFSYMIQKHLHYNQPKHIVHLPGHFPTSSAFGPPQAANNNACFLPQTPLPVFNPTRLVDNKFGRSTAGTNGNIPMISASAATDAYSQSSSSKNKLGRMYSPGRPLAMADRERILLLYERGHKISHIARIIGVTHSCVSKIMTRYRRTGSMRPRSSSGGSRTSSSSSNEVRTHTATVIVPSPTVIIKKPVITLAPNSSAAPPYSIQRLLFDG